MKKIESFKSFSELQSQLREESKQKEIASKRENSVAEYSKLLSKYGFSKINELSDEDRAKFLAELNEGKNDSYYQMTAAKRLAKKDGHDFDKLPKYDRTSDKHQEYYLEMAAKTEEGNSFSAARAKAIADGKKEFTVDGKTYPVEDVDSEDKENAEEFAGESVVTEKLSKSELNKIEDFLYDQDADTLRDICDDLLMDDEDYAEDKYDLDSDDLVGMAMDYIEGESIKLKDVKAMVESVVNEAKVNKKVLKKDLDAYADEIYNSSNHAYDGSEWYTNMNTIVKYCSKGDYGNAADEYLSSFRTSDGREMPDNGEYEEVMYIMQSACESVVNEAIIELDVIDPTDKYLMNTVKKLGLGMNIITWNGPGGGHPAVEFMGKRKDLETLLDKHFGGKEEFEEFIEESNKQLNEAIIELDVIDPTDKYLMNTVKKLGLGMNIITWNGPGGGHPAVEFIGKRKDLETLLDKHFGGKEEFEEFIEETINTAGFETIEERNAFIFAAAKAKKEGKKRFKFKGKTFPVTLKVDLLK
jgi:hypothetical protein